MLTNHRTVIKVNRTTLLPKYEFTTSTKIKLQIFIAILQVTRLLTSNCISDFYSYIRM